MEQSNDTLFFIVKLIIVNRHHYLTLNNEMQHVLIVIKLIVINSNIDHRSINYLARQIMTIVCVIEMIINYS